MASEQLLLEALLDSWDQNNTILLNLLRILPKGGLEARTSRIEQMLKESAKAVRDAVKGRREAGRGMDLHYDHPILLLEHMVWQEGYHHG